jgi:UDP-N-acetylbacillosamine N-acetyltransferase
MDNKVSVIGSGGHSRSVIALLIDQGFEIIGIYDDSYNKEENEVINSVKLVGKIKDYNGSNRLILSVGDNKKRKELFNNFSKQVYPSNIFHSRCFLEGSSILGASNLIFGNVLINANAEIGDNNIINTGAILEHEVQIGSHNHISVGAIICGRVKIGNSCFIGAGAVINDQISICDGVTIGSNSVVINSIEEPGVYVGNPVHKMYNKRKTINE